MSLKTLRNVAIIMLVALAITVLPGGGDFASAVGASVAIAFLVAIGFLGQRMYRAGQLTLLSMNWQHRLMLYGGLGVILLAVSATSKLLSSGVGVIAWFALLIGAGFTIYTVIIESRRYSV